MHHNQVLVKHKGKEYNSKLHSLKVMNVCNNMRMLIPPVALDDKRSSVELAVWLMKLGASPISNWILETKQFHSMTLKNNIQDLGRGRWDRFKKRRRKCLLWLWLNCSPPCFFFVEMKMQKQSPSHALCPWKFPGKPPSCSQCSLRKTHPPSEILARRQSWPTITNS